jgi:hypothetical protein
MRRFFEPRREDAAPITARADKERENMNEFLTLFQLQPTAWRVFIASVLIVCVAIGMGGLLALLDLIFGCRQ